VSRDVARRVDPDLDRRERRAEPVVDVASQALALRLPRDHELLAAALERRPRRRRAHGGGRLPHDIREGPLVAPRQPRAPR